MCGICGFTRFRENLRGLPQLNQMLKQLRHRGPDGVGVFNDKNILMGNARLSIIDIDGGDQPIYNENKTIAIVFNGMIYNYLELRKLLIARGHQFTTKSDTEVIVHLYEEFGHEECFRILDGMFAVAIWDANINKLFLAVDFFGKKPIYYHQGKEELFFASELKAIASNQAIDKTIDYQ